MVLSKNGNEGKDPKSIGDISEKVGVKIGDDSGSINPDYVVVQTGMTKGKAVSALFKSPYKFPDWPLTIAAPLFHGEGIYRGDILRFDLSAVTLDWTVNDLVFNQSKVKAHANGIPEHIERANIVKTLGIVTGRTRARNAQHRNNRWAVGCANQGPPIVDVYGLAIPARLTEDQIVGGSSDEVGIGEIVLAGVFELPDGSRCNASYWLPPDFPKTENWELEVQRGKGYTDMHVSYIEPLPFALDELYLPVVLEDMIELAENSVALANQVYANELKELARKTSVTSELALVSLTESQTVEGRQ